MPLRIAESVLAHGERAELSAFDQWWSECAQRTYTRVRRTMLSELAGWDGGASIIRHQSGKFFTIEGLDIEVPERAVSRWSQPIIVQPEVGILGILVKEFDGVLHCLMQAKVEPGNSNGLQLSPTVQATRSNYTRVHGGKAVPYLEYFLELSRHQVVADVRQSEQGSAFYQKRNRNMVVETDGEVELLDGFRWLTVGQVYRLLMVNDLVNMDARTVLSCLPFYGAGLDSVFALTATGFRAALLSSCTELGPSIHTFSEILSWITDARTRIDVRTRRMPLHELRGWRRTAEKISHDSGLFFSVIGVDVEAGGREVARWMQPMVEAHGIGLVAFLVHRIGGVLHILVHARVEPGYVDVVELAPTVQCTPGNYDYLPTAARPPFLDAVLGADPHRVMFDTTLSEEGGRFYHARNRYVIIEVDDACGHPEYRWMTMRQLAELLRHSHYLNVQARSLVACLHSLLVEQESNAMR